MCILLSAGCWVYYVCEVPPPTLPSCINTDYSLLLLWAVSPIVVRETCVLSPGGYSYVRSNHVSSASLQV
jgi:hypothetical protein